MVVEATHDKNDGYIFPIKERFKLSDKFLDNYRDKQPQWGPLGYVVYKRTYSRILENGKYEEFWETLKRVVEGCYTIQLNHCKNLRLPWNAHKSQKSAQKMYDLMWNFKFLPPGRGLWGMGTEVVYMKGSAILNNCAFTSTKDIKYTFSEPFVWCMDMCMFGVGVAFDTLGANQIKILEPKIDDNIFVIEDTREAWCETIRIVIDSYFGQNKLPKEFDFSQIRPNGAIIKTFGGIAPGPEPLIEGIKAVKKVLDNRINEYLTSVDIVDIMNIVGKIVVSGGVRRSAELALGSATDNEYMSMKDPELFGEQLISHRWACVAGDTVVDTTKGLIPIKDLCNETNIQIILDGKIYNTLGAKKTKRDKTLEIITAGGQSIRTTRDHLLMTTEGWKKAESISIGTELIASNNYNSIETNKDSVDYKNGYLIGSLIGDGSYTVTSTTKSDIARILIYEKDNGHKSLIDYISSIFEFKTRSDFNGFSGPHGKDSSKYYFISSKEFTKLCNTYGVMKGNKTITDEIEKGSNNFIAGVCSGLFDTDGWILKDRKTLGIEQADKKILIRMQRMLLKLGIMSRVNKVKNEEYRIITKEKPVKCKELWRLVISGYDQAKEFIKLCDIHHNEKKMLFESLEPPKFSKAYYKFKVNNIIEHEEEDVYDVCVPDKGAFTGNGFYIHNSNNSVVCDVGMDYEKLAEQTKRNGEPGFVYLNNMRKFGRIKDGINWTDRAAGGTNPCSEMTLFDGELCCLVETFPSNHSSAAEYKETLKYAYLYAKSVTLVPSHQEKTNQVMLQNRRIGISMSGIAEALTKHGHRVFFNDFCDKGYEYIDQIDIKYSNWLCIPKSIKKTTIKPSGCRPINSLTSTDAGILTLEEILENHSVNDIWSDVDGINVYNENNSINKVSKSYKNGKSKLIKIKFNYNLEFECTPNHKLYVIEDRSNKHYINIKPINDWVEADKIKQGYVIDINMNSYNKETPYEFIHVQTPKNISGKRGVSITQPKNMNNDIAWLLGYLWGDGSLSPNKTRTRFIDRNIENLEKVKDIMLKTFNLNCSIHPASGDRDAFVLEISSKHLWNFWTANSINKYKDDKTLQNIPKCIRTSTKENILSFLAGLLDSDGCVSICYNKKNDKKSIGISFCSSYDTLAKNIQEVGFSVGLCIGRSLNCKGENLQHEKHIWLLSLNCNTDPKSLEILKNNSTKIKNKIINNPDSEFKCLSNASNSFINGKVLEVIETEDEVETYDIEVENEHWYYSCGIKSHNTVSLLPGVSPGIHYPHAEFFIRRMEIQKNSPLIEPLEKAGYRKVQSVYKENSWIFEFPIKTENYKKGKNEITIWEQMALHAAMQHYWSDNNISQTVTFTKDEADSIKDVLEYYEDKIKAVSFLPLSDHAYEQAPYEEIDENEYNLRKNEIKSNPDFSNIEFSVEEDIKQKEGNKFCDGDKCELK